MRDHFRYFNEFIAEQKSFFEEALLPEVNAGINDPKKYYSWEKNNWSYSPASHGFLAKATKLLNFDKIKASGMKGLIKPKEKTFKALEINKNYSAFMKAYCVLLYKRGDPSGAAVLAQQLILKRVYVRMVMTGVDPHPVRITSELLQDATDMLAKSRTGNSAITNAAKDYDDANVIAQYLNHAGFTMNQIEIKKKQKGIATRTTKVGKRAKRAEYAEDLDEEEHEKNLSIQTFLNVVALRGMVQHDSERIVLNLVLLLMVTGFRHMEAAATRYNSFKVVEIEDQTIKARMEKRGLPTFYLGIVYLGEKGAGHRTHWIEPLAVEVVDELWVDTIVLTEKLRSQIEYVRKIGFKSLLPKAWLTRPSNDNVVVSIDPLVNLDDIVDEVYESFASTVASRGRATARGYAKRKITNSGLDIVPNSVIALGGNKKEIRYRQSDIERFVRNAVENDPDISNDFIYRQTDSKTKAVSSVPYEELLFIIPQGSAAMKRTGALKVVPEIIHLDIFSPFLGYGGKGNRERSIFAKYNLSDENGEIATMHSHTPRHGINTFFAIAGVSEHLQAMFMGRRDFTQNENYQHLAIKEKAVSSALVAVNNTESFFKEGTALEYVKSEAVIGLNSNLSLDNAFAQAMHTHTTTQDKTSFVVDMVNNSDTEIFSEFDELFAMMDEAEKKVTASPHSDLNALVIGSCMRKLYLFQCPYNMKCQDGAPCPYFTLTGRDDELPKIEELSACIKSEIAVINRMEMTGDIEVDEADEILEELNIRRENIKYHLGQAHASEREKVKINLLELDNMKKPKMLSSLFALEQREIDKRKVKVKESNKNK
ncbi:hypothetical protein VPH80_000935 [Vibrio parahaemolyticus]|uniref:hypothetical protein n=2 Tax=Vibrio parahaemolyticus TaxID=670 RepID=UPI00193E4565|nr:hypothetical protein [Vibrio parahaemolyticus]EHK4782641.1 hypothetical protein [Vibrio parahaemolyticus]EMC9921778.1 hypothetical protein [Vibrio parahaemolyticus]MBM4989795.1 hypothetical protein [Vibrio parahaemolyticus]MBM4993933.1 hypothetical protein [Vibrio parahaemolyticus]MDS1790620.1 hypothetical protein [Vibrio parahaemolyticus]